MSGFLRILAALIAAICLLTGMYPSNHIAEIAGYAILGGWSIGIVLMSVFVFLVLIPVTSEPEASVSGMFNAFAMTMGILIAAYIAFILLKVYVNPTAQDEIVAFHAVCALGLLSGCIGGLATMPKTMWQGPPRRPD